MTDPKCIWGSPGAIRIGYTKKLTKKNRTISFRTIDLICGEHGLIVQKEIVHIFLVNFLVYAILIATWTSPNVVTNVDSGKRASRITRLPRSVMMKNSRTTTMNFEKTISSI